jgi:hypothetical protein
MPVERPEAVCGGMKNETVLFTDDDTGRKLAGFDYVGIVHGTLSDIRQNGAEETRKKSGCRSTAELGRHGEVSLDRKIT